MTDFNAQLAEADSQAKEYKKSRKWVALIGIAGAVSVIWSLVFFFIVQGHQADLQARENALAKDVETYGSIKSKIEELKNDVPSYQRKADEAKEEARIATQSAVDAEAKKKLRDDVANNLQIMSGDLNKATNDRDTAKAEKQNLEKAIDVLNTQKNTLSDDVGKLEKAKIDADKLAQDAAVILERKQVELDALSKNISDSKAAKDELDNQIDDLRSQKIEAQNTLDQKVAAAQTADNRMIEAKRQENVSIVRRDEATKAADAADVRRTAIESTITGFEKERDDLQASIQVAKDQLAPLNSKIAEFDQVQKQLVEVQGKLSAANTDLQAKKKIEEQYNIDVSATSKAAQDLKAANNILNNILYQKASEETALLTARAQKAEVDAQTQTLLDYTGKKTQLEKEIDDKKGKLSEIEGIISQRRSELATVEQDLVNAKSEREELKSTLFKIDGFKKTVSQLQASIDSLEEQKKNLDSAVQETNSTLAAVSGKLAAKNTQLTILSTQPTSTNAAATPVTKTTNEPSVAPGSVAKPSELNKSINDTTKSGATP